MAKCSAIRISLLFIDLFKQRHDGTPFQITRLHIQHFQQIWLRFKTIRRVIHTDAETDGVICCAHPTSRLESDRVALHHETRIKLVLVIINVRQHVLGNEIIAQVVGNRIQIRCQKIEIIMCGIVFLESRKGVGQFQAGPNYPSSVLNHTLVCQCPSQGIDFSVVGHLSPKHVCHLVIGARSKQLLFIGHVLRQILQFLGHLNKIRESPHHAVLLKTDKTAIIMGLGLLQVIGRGMLVHIPTCHHEKQKHQKTYGQDAFHWCKNRKNQRTSISSTKIQAGLPNPLWSSGRS